MDCCTSPALTPIPHHLTPHLQPASNYFPIFHHIPPHCTKETTSPQTQSSATSPSNRGRRFTHTLPANQGQGRAAVTYATTQTSRTSALRTAIIPPPSPKISSTSTNPQPLPNQNNSFVPLRTPTKTEAQQCLPDYIHPLTSLTSRQPPPTRIANDNITIHTALHKTTSFISSFQEIVHFPRWVGSTLKRVPTNS